MDGGRSGRKKRKRMKWVKRCDNAGKGGRKQGMGWMLGKDGGKGGILVHFTIRDVEV